MAAVFPAQRFFNQQEGIDTFTSEVLAGALRSIVGRLIAISQRQLALKQAEITAETDAAKARAAAAGPLAQAAQDQAILARPTPSATRSSRRRRGARTRRS